MKIKHILIIRFRRIGDSILALVLFHSLRKMFPEAKLHFVLNKEIAPLYEGHPDIDEVITFSKDENKHLFSYLKKIRKTIRTTHYDVIIDMRSTVRTLFFSLFSLSTPYRIGKKKWYSRFLHNYRIANVTETLDQVQENLMLLEPLNAEVPVQKISEFRLFLTEEEKAHFRNYMIQQGIDFNRPVILAAVTARLAYKVWDMDRMQEILNRIIKKYDAQIIFNFAGNEKDIAIALHQKMNNSPHIFTNIEANSLRELCALAANSHFFFGNEGGPRHLAQSFDIPAFAIYPPNIAKTRWLPNPGERFQGISVEDICSREELEPLEYAQRFNLITVEKVWEPLDKMLSQFLPR